MSRQDIPEKEMKILFLKSGNLCAFPNCTQNLLTEATDSDPEAVVGEMAHIVADARQGPRGRAPLAVEDRNKATNLVLLCRNHHRVVDTQPHTYSVPVLRQMKLDHEDRIRKRLLPQADDPPLKLVTEAVQSTVLAVTHLPEVVFAAPCSFTESQKQQVKENIDYRADSSALLPFVLNRNRLLSFYDLRLPNNPFSPVIEGEAKDVELLKSSELWMSPDGLRLFQILLNRTLHKMAGRRGIRYDHLQRRYYFAAAEGRKERTVVYNSLKNRRIKRSVAWCPTRRKTGEAKSFWWHVAAGFRFHRLSENQWCLSIRPERHLTKDGETPFPSEHVGRRVTSLKAKMYNDAYLKEVHFWCDYLSDGRERIILNFGTQSAIVSAQIVPITVTWPGVPNDQIVIPTREIPEDLFTFADLANATDGDEFNWDEVSEFPEAEFDESPNEVQA